MFSVLMHQRSIRICYKSSETEFMQQRLLFLCNVKNVINSSIVFVFYENCDCFIWRENFIMQIDFEIDGQLVHVITLDKNECSLFPDFVQTFWKCFNDLIFA